MKTLGCCFCVVLLALVMAPAQAREESLCNLTAADKTANARLSYDEFDQSGTLPSTARKLSDRGCYETAADAADDYLVKGPMLSEGAKQNILFHEGQDLALAGQERGGARLIAAAKDRTDTISDSGFDWNTYVVGTWAFLVKDKPELDRALEKLRSETGRGNQVNAGVLTQLKACFSSSYKQAYEDCRAK